MFKYFYYIDAVRVVNTRKMTSTNSSLFVSHLTVIACEAIEDVWNEICWPI